MLEVHEEEIDFYGDPKLESMVRFNGDFEQISVNVLETFSVMDQIKMANRQINQSVQLIESQNSII